MKNSQDRKQIVGDWLQRAQEDEQNITALIRDKNVSPSLVCFISQQMAEKYLKALLLFCSGDYPRIHDLTRLGILIEEHIKEAKELKESFTVLNSYYIGTRYATDFPEGFTWNMAEEAFGAAEKIKEFVIQEIVF